MSNNLEDILRDWYSAKKKAEELEEKISEYKSAIITAMNKKDTDVISSGNYTVKRKRISRSTISKANVPAELWKKYSTVCNFDTFHLKKA